MPVCKARFAIFAGIVLTITSCPTGHPEEWEEEPETEYAAFLEMLASLGVNTSQTPALDPMGNALPAGYNPLGTAPLYAFDTTTGVSGTGYGGISVLGQIHELFLAGIDFGNGMENSVYANFADGWPVASGALRAVREGVGNGESGVEPVSGVGSRELGVEASARVCGQR